MRRPICPDCKTPMSLVLTGKPRRREFKCTTCDTSDPMQTDATAWLSGELKAPC